MAYVSGLIAPKTSMILIGDAEIGSAEVQKFLKSWHWVYVLRQKGRCIVKQQEKINFQRYPSLANKTRQSVWLTACELTAMYALTVNLFVYWKAGEWSLSSWQPTCLAKLEPCKSINIVCGSKICLVNSKEKALISKVTKLWDFIRLSHLALAVVILYVRFTLFAWPEWLPKPQHLSYC